MPYHIIPLSLSLNTVIFTFPQDTIYATVPNHVQMKICMLCRSISLPSLRSRRRRYSYGHHTYLPAIPYYNCARIVQMIANSQLPLFSGCNHAAGNITQLTFPLYAFFIFLACLNIPFQIYSVISNILLLPSSVTSEICICNLPVYILEDRDTGTGCGSRCSRSHIPSSKRSSNRLFSLWRHPHHFPESEYNLSARLTRQQSRSPRLGPFRTSSQCPPASTR